MLRTSLLAALVFFAVTSARPQEPDGDSAPNEFFAKVCGAPVLSRDAEPPIVEAIRKKFGPFRPKTEKIKTVVVESNDVNAYTHNVTPERAVICIPTAMLKLMDGAEAELAFIMGHEIGHALDRLCKTSAGRAAITSSSLPEVQQRQCELRADEIGLALIRKAGYSPFAAVGAFGRLEMAYKGSTRTGILARLHEKDHPITADRIENLHRLLFEDAATAALLP